MWRSFAQGMYSAELDERWCLKLHKLSLVCRCIMKRVRWQFIMHRARQSNSIVFPFMQIMSNLVKVDMFIANYLNNTSGLMEKIFEGNSSAPLSTEVCFQLYECKKHAFSMFKTCVKYFKLNRLRGEKRLRCKLNYSWEEPYWDDLGMWIYS